MATKTALSTTEPHFPSKFLKTSHPEPIESGENENAQAPSKLKKSCEACASAKLRCSGDYPVCKRCKSRNLDCVFKSRKKRVNNPPKRTRPSICLDSDKCLYGHECCTKECIEKARELRENSCVLLPPLEINQELMWINHNAREGASWSIFCSLFRTYAREMSYGPLSFLLRRYLRVYQVHLRSNKGNYFQQALHRLSRFMELESLNLDCFFAKAKKMLALKFPVRSLIDQEEFEKFSMFVPSKIPGQKYNCAMVESCRPILQDMGNKLNSRIPVLRLRCDARSVYEPNSRFLFIEANYAFKQVFGMTGRCLEQRLLHSVEGFLPFGAGILSLLSTKEDAIMDYLQIMCIKTAALGHPKVLPFYSEMPCTNIFELKVKQSCHEAKLEPVSCLVDVVHRRLLDENSCYEEVYMKFTPMQPYYYLFDDSALEVDYAMHQELHKMHILEQQIVYTSSGEADSAEGMEGKSADERWCQEVKSDEDAEDEDELMNEVFDSTPPDFYNLPSMPSVGPKLETPDISSFFKSVNHTNEQFLKNLDQLSSIDLQSDLPWDEDL